MRTISAVIAGVIFLFSPGAILADGAYDLHSIIYGTQFYDPNDCTSPGNNTSGGVTTTLSGNGHLQQAFNFLVTKLGNNQQAVMEAAAIVGNMEQESGQGLNPTAVNPTTRAYGIAQWLGNRLTGTGNPPGLTGYAQQNGKPISDFNIQLNYLWFEVTQGFEKNDHALTDLKKDTAIEQMVFDWENDFERAGEHLGDPPMNNRIHNAKVILTQPWAKTNGGTGVGAATGATTGSTCATTTSVFVGGPCTVTSPIYPAQYSQNQLTNIFGDPGSATSHHQMDANLTNVNFNGHNVSVHKLIASCLQEVAKQIKAENIPYTIKDMGCYRFDSDNGSSNIGLRSYHTYGAACDINPATNPFVGDGTFRPHDMSQAYIQAFHDHGFTWGGDWHSVKDYMHFEFHGIIPNNVKAL
jgi:hypothetical protein